ncbi:hypothetical protein [Terrimonas pollutisoli]|uniref:hypothetical protein n=1 Tax=Terrimonas pollutisoli TaxID=3034147 RepID=UPI0023ED10F8|nr:hypothetical protein [Terrimonas sp. H1YJ31]
MNKIKLLLLLVINFSFICCDHKPYVEHKLKFEKVADDCNEQQTYFRMNSNFGGERYEFEKCLPADFSKEQLVTERRGDTVLASFKITPSAQTGNVYHLTLDIDSYPRYNYLTIDDETYSITSSEK